MHRLFWEYGGIVKQMGTHHPGRVWQKSQNSVHTHVYMCCACARLINLFCNRRASSACPSVKWGGCQYSCYPRSNRLSAVTGIWDTGSSIQVQDNRIRMQGYAGRQRLLLGRNLRKGRRKGCVTQLESGNAGQIVQSQPSDLTPTSTPVQIHSSRSAD